MYPDTLKASILVPKAKLARKPGPHLLDEIGMLSLGVAVSCGGRGGAPLDTYKPHLRRASTRLYRYFHDNYSFYQ